MENTRKEYATPFIAYTQGVLWTDRKADNRKEIFTPFRQERNSVCHCGIAFTDAQPISIRVAIIMKPEELSETTAINTSYGTGTHV
ncbi:hypothetical protein J6590_067374 [Homalodisca vitripennis]|nr:hypothetical protein J6590_067374 [Homalodisca vitripennis]